MTIRDEAGRVRAHEDAREQIPDNGREAQPLSEVTEDQGRTETTGERQDEIERVRHRPIVSRPGSDVSPVKPGA
jgi:hypothetical protein